MQPSLTPPAWYERQWDDLHTPERNWLVVFSDGTEEWVEAHDIQNFIADNSSISTLQLCS